MFTLGILLLGLGALPERMVPHPAAAAVLTRARVLFAVGGLGVLAGAAMSYLIG
jgi:hypothetical protein